MISFALAALLLLALTALHLTLGQKDVVRPLLGTDALIPDTIAVLFLCFHLVTLVMVLAAGAYVAAALSRAWLDVALAATALIGGLAAWSLVVVVWRKQRHRDLPQWIAFSLVALLGVAGHLTR